MANSHIGTPTFQAVNANIANDGSADSPRGWAISTDADYTFTAAGTSRARCTATGANRTVKLPKTGIKAGYEAEVVTACSGGYTVIIKSDDAVAVIDTLKGTKGRIRCIALIDTPAAAADWEVVQVEDVGTWTPVLSFGGASVGITYSASRVGSWQRIGNRCTVSCYFAITSNGTSTGAAKVDGLPFTAAAAPNLTCVSVWSGSVSISGYSLTGYITASGTSVELNGTSVGANAASSINLTEAHYADTGSLMINGSYPIA
jgi:hypothetical protein